MATRLTYAKKERDLSAIDKITPRQLRKVLFYLDNEDVTIKELRAELFDNDNQDISVNVNHALSASLGLVSYQRPTRRKGDDNDQTI